MDKTPLEQVELKLNNEDKEKLERIMDWPLKCGREDPFIDEMELFIQSTTQKIDCTIDQPLAKERVEFSSSGTLSLTTRRIIWFTQDELNNEDQSRKLFEQKRVEDPHEVANRMEEATAKDQVHSNKGFSRFIVQSQGGKAIEVRLEDIVSIELRESKIIVFVKEEIDRFDPDRQTTDSLKINKFHYWPYFKFGIYIQNTNIFNKNVIGRYEVQNIKHFIYIYQYKLYQQIVKVHFNVENLSRFEQYKMFKYIEQLYVNYVPRKRLE